MAAIARARTVTGGNPLYLRELLHHTRDRGADLSDGRRWPAAAARAARRRPARPTRAGRGCTRERRRGPGSDADPSRARTLAGLDAIDAIAAEATLRAERVLDADAYAFTHPLVAAAAREAIARRTSPRFTRARPRSSRTKVSMTSVSRST